MNHNCKEGVKAEVGIVVNPISNRWEFYHPRGREEIFFCPYCGKKLKSEITEMREKLNEFFDTPCGMHCNLEQRNNFIKISLFLKGVEK